MTQNISLNQQQVPMMAAWCNPVEHAIVLIDACGSLEAAHQVASDNCEFAGNDFDSLYWFNVALALTPPKVSA